MQPTTDSGQPRSLAAKVGFTLLSYGASALGAVAMRGKGSPRSTWFKKLDKPSFEPPSWVFGPVWTALYGTIAYAGYRVWKAPKSPARTRALALWGTQLALNAAWTPLFFRAHRPKAALVDLAALDLAAGAFVAQASKVDKRAAIALAPYLAWLSFASVLNGSIVAKND